jgi:hypothetical protein
LVKTQTPQICTAAVRQTYEASKFIKKVL